MPRLLFSHKLIQFGVTALVVLAALIGHTYSGAAAQSVDPVYQKLADTYAPIAMLRQQSEPCDKDGEGYFPAPVDWLFDNPRVSLRANGGGSVSSDPILASPVVPQQLAAAGPGSYLDFPYDPHSPGCLYESWFRQAVAEFDLQPATYAHIVIDEGKRKLYLQYWFWYPFNDWNNLHESDWEMIQLVFETTSAAEALEFGPDLVGFAQHEGGQLVRWDNSKLEREGTHLLVYPGAGSHATYPGSDLFISWGEHGSGFGCDNTTGPSRAMPLQAIVIPDPVDPESSFAWALFQGRWGQRAEPLFEGPLGPNLTLKWTDPDAAMADWTSAALSVPSGPSLGFDPTRTFCSWTEYGSRGVASVISNPILAAAIVIGALAVICFCLYRVRPYLLEALDIYGNELATFLGIGLVAIPIGFLFNGLTRLIANRSPFDQVLGWLDLSGGAAFTAASVVGGLQHVAMLLLVVPAVIQAMKQIRRGQRPTVAGSYRASIHHFPTMLLAWVIYFALIATTSLTVIAVPFALYFGITLQFFPQAVLLEHERPGWKALYCSWRTTRWQIGRTLARTLPFLILAVLPGPVVGITFLTLGGSRIQFANLASGFLYALMIPYSYIGVTMAWRRLRGDTIVEPLMANHIPRTDDLDLPPAPAGW